MGLRKEYEGLIKPYKDVLASADKIEALSKAPSSPQTDIALVFAYMKALDPTSVVRESEYATAENARGIPEGIRNSYNRAMDGNRMTPEQRMRIAATTGTLKQEAMANYTREAQRFSDLAQKYQFDPQDITGERLDGGTRPEGRERRPLSSFVAPAAGPQPPSRNPFDMYRRP